MPTGWELWSQHIGEIIAAAILGGIAYLNSHKTRQAVDAAKVATDAKLDVISVNVNGRITALIEEKVKAAYAQGVLDGGEAVRTAVKLDAGTVVKAAETLAAAAKTEAANVAATAVITAADLVSNTHNP